MSVVQGADIVVQGDLGAHPFILDRDLLDANPGSELTPQSAAWDEVTCEVTSIRWSWGASDPMGPLTETDGGTCELNLYDPDRSYDPSNTASPYFVFLNVGTPLRFLVDGQAAWQGTLEAWEWDAGEKVSTLRAVDAIATLAALILPLGTSLTGAPTATHVTGVLDAIGWPAANRSISVTSAVSLGGAAYTGSALDAIAKIRFSELGTFYSRAGILTWRGRGETPSATPTVIINCGGVGLVGLTSTFNRGRVRNVVMIDDTPTPFTASLPSSATRHGPRTVSTTRQELNFSSLLKGPNQQAWADTILNALGQPKPATRLGTLVPQGAVQVDPILRADWGDTWRLVHTDSSPPIDRLVRVLGERVSITATTIEVDAVTEDI